jgi:hypothetical protein
MRPEDRIVSVLSHWLAGHVDNTELRRTLEQIGTEGLGAGETEAVEELLEQLARARPGERGGLEMLVRETVEALALGV